MEEKSSRFSVFNVHELDLLFSALVHYFNQLNQSLHYDTRMRANEIETLLKELDLVRPVKKNV